MIRQRSADLTVGLASQVFELQILDSPTSFTCYHMVQLIPSLFTKSRLPFLYQPPIARILFSNKALLMGTCGEGWPNTIVEAGVLDLFSIAWNGLLIKDR